MSLVRKIVVGLAAGGGVLLAVSPASAAPLSPVDSLGEKGPHTTVSDVRESFQKVTNGLHG